MKNNTELKEKVNRFFGEEKESLIGSMLWWGFSGKEFSQAEKQGFIKCLGKDESIVFKTC